MALQAFATRAVLLDQQPRQPQELVSDAVSQAHPDALSQNQYFNKAPWDPCRELAKVKELCSGPEIVESELQRQWGGGVGWWSNWKTR